jgi:hypothetical protein
MINNFLENYFLKYKNIKNLMRNEINYLTKENDVKVVNVSSEMQGCGSENILNSDKKVFIKNKFI